MPIVLASASPRRHELLKNAGIEFTVKPANIPEVRRERESPKAFAERMAREKARAIVGGNKDECILGADTVVAVSGVPLGAVAVAATGVSPVDLELVLGKPQSPEDAARMLRLLSGRTHQVITGVCLIGSNFEDTRSENTLVHFSALSDADIRDYVISGEPMDKAGAYAIQGAASRWISKIEGDYSNVVGLPIPLVLQMLREHRVIES
jgi:septum formation protein